MKKLLVIGLFVVLLGLFMVGGFFGGGLNGNMDSEPGSHTTDVGDSSDNADVDNSADDTVEPDAYVEPIVDPVVEPVVRETDYGKRVAGDEVVLHNGVRFGMDFAEVANLIGYTGAMPEDEYFSIEQDDIWYGFAAGDDGGVWLSNINIQEEAVDASIFRDIKIGDSIESVFERIPAKDTELKKWAWQDLYGSRDSEEYAALKFVAMSYYAMRIATPEGSAHLTFSRSENRVKWMELYAPGV